MGKPPRFTTTPGIQTTSQREADISISPFYWSLGPMSYLLKTQLFNFLGNMGYMSVKD